MKLRIAISAALIWASGCTHIREYSQYDEIHFAMIGKKSELEFLDGTTIVSEQIRITPDSTYWYDLHEGGTVGIPTSEVHRVIIVNRWRGAWEGMRGFLISGAILGIIGLAAGDDTEGFFRFSADEKFLIGVAVGTGFGIVLGLPLGGLIGSQDVYTINPRAEGGMTLHKSKPVDGEGRRRP